MPKIFSEQERQMIRNKLLHAGMERLEHKSYHHISIDEIAADVGIAKGTFYNFFDSKESYFYQIMQLIKERNRRSLQELLINGRPARDKIAECLYHRYTEMKTVYDYFSSEEIKLITRKLPNDNLENDSVEFAKVICSHLRVLDEKEASTIVSMCNILGMAASNRTMYEPNGYKSAIRVFCNTMTDYILGREK